jgi:glycosyltransferase involved in cell wall biosynthesis
VTLQILHIIPSLSPHRGGPAAVAINLVRELNQLGAIAEICTTNDDGQGTLAVPLGRKIEYAGVPVWFFPRWQSPIGRDRAFLASPQWARWLWRRIPDYDVLDTHYLFSFGSSAAAAIARWRQVPYTMRTMGQLAPWALAQSRKKKRLYSWLRERKNLNRAAVIHCTTAGEAADVRRFGVKTPTAVLPLGVQAGTLIPDAGQTLRSRYLIPENQPILLYLGRLHYKKRPDFLLDVISTIYADFHLLLAGTTNDPAYLDQLQAHAERLGLRDRVTFTGLVTGEDKELVLQGADVFVLPSFAENFAIAVAEAMAAGLPVVVTPEVQLAPTISQAAAGLVIPAQTEAWGSAIAQLLQNPEQRQILGQNGREFAKKVFDWSAIAQQLLELYAEVVKR